MKKKLLILLLFLLLAFFQYQLWLSSKGVPKTIALQSAIHKQQEQNQTEEKHNNNLKADIASLKKDTAAIEKHARSDLGMIKEGEKFYQVIPQKK